MANPHYTNTNDLTAGTRAKAGDVEANFDAVEAGFDSVETLKANLASPTFTGTPRAPTQSASDNSTKIATTAYADAASASVSSDAAAAAASAAAASSSASAASGSASAASGSASSASGFATAASNSAGAAAASAVAASASADDAAASAASIQGLPTQTGHNGEWLTTNGSAASWAALDALPPQTSHNGEFLTTNGTTASWTAAPEEIPAQTGNSGKFLTTNGSAVSWADPASNVLAPGATIVSEYLLAHAATASGLTSAVIYGPWVYDIDSDRQLIVFSSNVAGIGISAFVYNETTDTYGSVTQISTSTGAIEGRLTALKTATDTFLIAYSNGTDLAARVISLSGTTITANAEATVAAGAAITEMGNIIACGSSYVISFLISSSGKVVACTISGTTITFGTAVAVTGVTQIPPVLFDINGTDLLAIHMSSTLLYASPYTISGGTTLTLGTEASTACTAQYNIRARAFGTTGRWAVLYNNTTAYGAVVNVTGTTATISTASIAASYNSLSMKTFADYAICVVASNTSGTRVAVLRDNAGTASVGTTRDLKINAASAGYGYICAHNSTSVTVATATGMFNISSTSYAVVINSEYAFGVDTSMVPLYATTTAPFYQQDRRAIVLPLFVFNTQAVMLDFGTSFRALSVVYDFTNSVIRHSPGFGRSFPATKKLDHPEGSAWFVDLNTSGDGQFLSVCKVKAL